MGRISLIIPVNLFLLVLIFFITETMLHVFDIPVYGSFYPMISKETYIRKHIPNEPYVYRDEGYSSGRFNSMGYRDYERNLSKLQDTFRIAVVGDSFVEALQVSQEKNFCALLERKLNNVKTQKFEVMNFGVIGYATGDAYLLLTEEVMQYEPDLVLLAFFAPNDIIGNSPMDVLAETTVI